MDSDSTRLAAERRAAVAAALGVGEWPWPFALRTDDSFIDGLCALATACDRAGVEELGFAAAIADENPERSAVARLLLQLRRENPTEITRVVEPEPSSGVRSSAARSLAEAFEMAKQVGAADVVMRRWIVEAIGEPPAGLRLHPRGADDLPMQTASIEFADEPGSAVQARGWAESLGAAPDALSSGEQAQLRIIVDVPAQYALAEWFAGAEPDEEAWAWPAPEAPRPLVAPAMTFSASRLNGFVKCPRRWFFEYLCDALIDEGSAAATYGKVFHEALEALHRTIREPADWSGNSILERLHGELDLAFERNRNEFASRLEFEVSRLRARAVAAHYARWLRAEAQDHPMQVEAVESLQRWTMRGYTFVGFIDRIDRPAGGGPITIYDYKTGRIEEDPRAYVAAMRRGDEAQLALYYAVRRTRGDDVGRLALVSLRDPRDPVTVMALDMVDDQGKAVVERDPRSGIVRGSCTPADMEAAIDALLARADELTTGGIEHFYPGEDPPCSYCAYAHACRERPADGERVFAR